MGSKPTKPEKNSARAGFLNLQYDSYLESTGRPLYALVFLLPWIGLYELGTILINTDHIAHTQSRVTAFTWLMGMAQAIGMNQKLAWAFPGFVVVIILLCWHLVERHSWRIHLNRIAGMMIESVLLAGPLFVLGILANAAGTSVAAPAAAASTPTQGSYAANLVTSIGAGIYEELIFRLILIGLLVIFFQDVLKLKEPAVTLLAVGVSAILFAAHHYAGVNTLSGGESFFEPFTLPGFLFRMAAGVYFAVIFRYRGYGITAGAHAAYNMIYFAFS